MTVSITASRRNTRRDKDLADQLMYEWE
jgi:hypothetical protein